MMRDHLHAGVILIGDFNQLHDAALLAYPLRKVAKSATRGSAVLDKIYTSLKDWYGVPSVMPNIGRSDHDAVVMTPKPRRTDRGEDVVVTVRNQDSKGEHCWAKPSSILDTCNEMTESFYRTVMGLIDYHLPLMTVKRHTKDKPWVTDQFRCLIHCRQHALMSGQNVRYRAYRNRVQGMSRTLWRKYYARKLEGLRHSDPRTWWRSVKLITGQSVRLSR